jgi:protocatechuate 3,4-dioxygenase beta subunit
VILRVATLVACALVLNAGSAGATGNACPTTNHPNELVLAGGSGQTAQLGKPFETPFQVELANTNGCPLTGNLAGITVNFDAPGAGPSGIFSSTGSREAYIGTDAQGIATAPTFVANDTTGAYTVDAHSDYGSVELFVSNTAAGLAAKVAAAGPTAQEAPVNGQYAQPLQAQVVDANGNPVQGATVQFAIVPGPTGASATFLGGQGTATTNSSGVATSPALVANGIPGKFTATASVDGVAAVVVYALDNHAVVALITGQGGARTRVDTTFRYPLTSRVVDANGRPVEGATVTFAVAQSATGASATFVGGASQATATTDVNGEAVSPRLVANKVAGSFAATASTTAAAGTVHYLLMNLPGAPATIVPGAASGQAATVHTRFAVPFAVTVTDAEGNPVPHAVVVFRAPAKGPGGHFAKLGGRVRVATNAKGIAVAPPFVANGKPGGYVVTATVAGKRVAFALRNESRL